MSCPVFPSDSPVQVRYWWGSSTKLLRWPGHMWAEGQSWLCWLQQRSSQGSRNSPQLLEGPLQRWQSQTLLCSGKQDSNGHKLKHGRSQPDMRRSFLTGRWCSTDTGWPGVLKPPPLGVLETWWDMATADMICWWEPCFKGSADPPIQPGIWWSAELLPGASTETSDVHFNHNTRFSPFRTVSSNITQKE